MLGIPETATDDEVKKAYRDLVRKYHPDKYGDNPLADVAAEKMKEINAAYDQITKDRKAGVHPNYDGGASYQNPFGGGYYGGNSYGGNSYSGSSRFTDIRRLIQQNRIAEAEELLDGVADGSRTAEWYFLKGHIYYSRGWLGEAMNNFRRAYQMEPNNMEYANAYQQCSYRQQYGTPRSYPGGGSASYCNFDACDCCTSLICLNMCCRGGGGCCC